jgi:hypothetical protein
MAAAASDDAASSRVGDGTTWDIYVGNGKNVGQLLNRSSVPVLVMLVNGTPALYAEKGGSFMLVVEPPPKYVIRVNPRDVLYVPASWWQGAGSIYTVDTRSNFAYNTLVGGIHCLRVNSAADADAALRGLDPNATFLQRESSGVEDHADHMLIEWKLRTKPVVVVTTEETSSWVDKVAKHARATYTSVEELNEAIRPRRFAVVWTPNGSGRFPDKKSPTFFVTKALERMHGLCLGSGPPPEEFAPDKGFIAVVTEDELRTLCEDYDGVEVLDCTDDALRRRMWPLKLSGKNEEYQIMLVRGPDKVSAKRLASWVTLCFGDHDNVNVWQADQLMAQPRPSLWDDPDAYVVVPVWDEDTYHLLNDRCTYNGDGANTVSFLPEPPRLS